jgi:hypothetical protein
MGKRFEGSQPSFQDMLSGFRLLGLDRLIGSTGENTAFGWPSTSGDDYVEFAAVPGVFSAREIQDLYRDAGLAVL